VIYRYYDIDSQLFGKEFDASMETYGWGLGRLVTDVLKVTHAPEVYLVAHSMGGLVARTFLQNADVLDKSHPRSKRNFPVDTLIAKYEELKLTQAQWGAGARRGARVLHLRHAAQRHHRTGRLGNGLLGTVSIADRIPGRQFQPRADEGVPRPRPRRARQFARRHVRGRKDLLPDRHRLGGLSGGLGLSRRLVGQLSDGLVEVDNAFVFGPGPADAPDNTVLAARAYVRRAHSGPYGMVNSEEGFGNLARFLFGDLRVDGDLHVVDIGLPPRVDAARKEGKRSARVVQLRELPARAWRELGNDGAAGARRRRDLPALRRAVPREGDQGPDLTAEEERKKKTARRIELFAAFLDSGRRAHPEREETIEEGTLRITGSMGFALRLRVVVPDYEVDGFPVARRPLRGQLAPRPRPGVPRPPGRQPRMAARLGPEQRQHRAPQDRPAAGR
jgi:hypothetical protein